jgi:hypothetical protein
MSRYVRNIAWLGFIAATLLLPLPSVALADAPLQPQLEGPEDGAVIDSNDWFAAAGSPEVFSTRVQYATEDEFSSSSIVCDTGWFRRGIDYIGYWTLSGEVWYSGVTCDALPRGVYYWRVLASSEDPETGEPTGEESTSEVRSFRYEPNEPPAVPTDLSPPDGTVSASQNPTLWARYDDPDEGDAGRVEFQLWSGNPTPPAASTIFSSPDVDPGELAAATTPTSLSFAETHYWRARSNDGGLASDWSPVMTYRPSHSPLPPVRLFPSAGVAMTTTPTFSAIYDDPDAGSSGSVFFEVRNATTNAIVASGAGTSVQPGRRSTWVVTSALVNGQTYKWRARSQDGSLSSAFTPDRSLLISVGGDVYHAKAYTANPAAGGELIEEEWAQINTTTARHVDGETIVTRSPAPCPSPSAEQCSRIRGFSAEVATDTSYWDSTSWDDDPVLEQIATILEPALDEWSEPQATGSSSSILAPWQVAPPLSAGSYELYELQDGAILLRRWIDTRTRLPLKEATYESGTLIDSWYWTYDAQRIQASSLPASHFAVAEPGGSTTQVVNTQGAGGLSPVINQASGQPFEPLYLGTTFWLSTPGGSMRFCLTHVSVASDDDGESGANTYVFADYVQIGDAVPCAPGVGEDAPADLSVMSIPTPTALAAAAMDAHIDPAEEIAELPEELRHGSGTAAVNALGLATTAYVVPVGDAFRSAASRVATTNGSVEQTTVVVTGPVATENLSALMTLLRPL